MLQRISQDNFEYFSIETTPSRKYSTRLKRDASGSLVYYTGSQGNIEEMMDNTGSIQLFTFRSQAEKDTTPVADFSSIKFDDSSFELLRRGILENTSTNIENSIQTYLSAVYDTTSSLRKQQKLEIIRFVPTFNFTSNTVRKTITTDKLMPYHRVLYPTYDFSFSNFYCLNFFNVSSSNTQYQIPSQSAILYPNEQGNLLTSGVYDSAYGFEVSSAYSIDFWIKPRYTIDNEGDTYKAGCILQLSSSYAVSLLSGSSKDANGRTDKFRLMLQLSSGSGLSPSQDVASIANGVFVTDDNILELNTWQHVTIRCGGSRYNNNSGSIIVDSKKVKDFNYFNNGFGLYDTIQGTSPGVLCIGNFYEGPPNLSNFFNATVATRDGLIELTTDTTEPPANSFKFDHPLNAEIHDVKIYNKYLTDDDIVDLDTAGPSNLNNLQFYLPPFFTEESPYRQFIGTWGGVLITPFQEEDDTTATPFGNKMAFGVGGHYMNLENYVRDFATGAYPRLWYLTGSAFEPASSVEKSANYFLYASGANAGANKKRLYTALPCDHGNWQPTFNLLENMSGSKPGGRYRDSDGRYNPGIVSLRNIVTGVNELTSRAITTSGSILDDVLGATPDNISGTMGSSLTMLHRLRDGSSNQVVLFDVSNMFYGLKIKPSSILLTDPHLSCSEGKMNMQIRDDGLGNLYRADTSGSCATWSSIGNVFYEEGILILKSPELFFFGNHGFDIEFRGIQNVHTMAISAYARSMQLLSSSNPNYNAALEYDSGLANEPDQKFVYLTTVNLHDENLNVVMRAKLAQPIKKKSGDKYKIILKMDF